MNKKLKLAIAWIILLLVFIGVVKLCWSDPTGRALLIVTIILGLIAWAIHTIFDNNNYKD